ncbi:MAG: uracil-DNA glycosylase [Methanophagales archaeon]|nr:uracil-DNA glycosylase [Methanophagales archaeon]MCW3138488.1 uracil-DNA glycosylase [Methanophagales archaeon]MCW3140250.1 uracil-DNA glycosylase [Methanophagales archaeon]MCW7070229.1 uracil-DNA glycosylase [Methanophagales archaeon]MCW7072468.1 uracil-DNA glycosylase [Methanophagales archaeon]
MDTMDTMDMAERGIKIKNLESKIRVCKLCELWKTRTNPVIGEGSISTGIMFIGEAPGYYEDLQGRPFVGKAGRILDELLRSVALERADVYITNVLKCRPPGNRNPKPEEIVACAPYLDSQLAIIEPEVIVTLGSFSLSYIFHKFGLKPDKISKIHGRVFTVSTISGVKRIISLYHPAVATYNPGMKEVLKEDFKQLADCL